MNIGAISPYKSFSYITPYSNRANSIQDSPKTSETQAVHAKKVDKTDPNYECKTCENRKYQDGSNEQDVSFKSAINSLQRVGRTALNICGITINRIVWK